MPLDGKTIRLGHADMAALHQLAKALSIVRHPLSQRLCPLCSETHALLRKTLLQL